MFPLIEGLSQEGAANGANDGVPSASPTSLPSDPKGA